MKSIKKKADIVQAIILGIERLLPDKCGECSEIYVVKRDSVPGLECKGCGQGFHQPCLVKLTGGMSAFPTLPGSLHWLCGSCTPYFELSTKVGQGGRSKPTRRCNVPPSTSPAAATATDPQTSASPTAAPPPPPPQIRAGLPYLWGGMPAAAASDTADSATPSPPPPPPPLTVKCGLPFLFQKKQSDAELDCLPYMRGECQHGVSGKAGGGCDKQHRKRCAKFMKWGDRNKDGCNDGNCSKIHPLVCGKSLDLKCFDKACPYKLHILKCKRMDTAPTNASDRTRTAQKTSTGPRGQEKGRGGPPFHPWEPSRVPGNSTQQCSGAPESNSNPNFQKLTVQPQLEAYMYNMRKELWQEVGFLRSFMARELQLAQQEGSRPFC